MIWFPITLASMPKTPVLLYFPAIPNDRYGHNGHAEMMQIGYYSAFPYRRPTHWMPLPEPPCEE
jgi:hypothetical protein